MSPVIERLVEIQPEQSEATENGLHNRKSDWNKRVVGKYYKYLFTISRYLFVGGIKYIRGIQTENEMSGFVETFKSKMSPT